MMIIGLTGGIGTGKSTVSDYLSKKEYLILDADAISRQMTQKGQPALQEIGSTFGFELIDDKGNLDRQALGNIVFTDRKKLDLLQKIITNKVVEYIDEKIEELKKTSSANLVFIDAPLLYECGMDNMTDENWLVSADLNVRIERVKKRDNLSEKQILSRINNQMSQEEKESKSQIILDNSGSLDELYRQIDYNLERIENEF